MAKLSRKFNNKILEVVQDQGVATEYLVGASVTYVLVTFVIGFISGLFITTFPVGDLDKLDEPLVSLGTSPLARVIGILALWSAGMLFIPFIAGLLLGFAARILLF